MTQIAQRVPTLSARATDESELDGRLREVTDELRTRAARHHHAFRDLVDHLAGLVLGGKRLRSRLLLAVWRSLSRGDRQADAALDVACALELLHNALLAHDDVIDNDTVRRGEPNVSGRAAARAARLGTARGAADAFGAASGIIAGDLLLATAQRLVATCDVDTTTRRRLVELLDEAIVDAAAGEHADAWFGLGSEESDAGRVLRTTELKTARYSFQAPLVAAAVLAGTDHHTAAALDRIGRGLGVVYQLRDDVLGVYGDPELTGKSVHGDLREGKQTLLVSVARTSPGWTQVAHLFGSPTLTDAGAEELRAVIRDSGALAEVERTVRAECDAVRRHIEEAGLDADLERLLLDVLARCAERAA
ncbi:polyprenyl synthetase family protein [Georgenia sp. Z1344]|uniref:polyprenyl synthetase family protein n=1 Tax=Georgenia sp. Z1344 TaxID=3416706 RepID=UPI003CF0C721